MKSKVEIHENKTVAVIEGDKNLGIPFVDFADALKYIGKNIKQNKILYQFTTIEGSFVFILTD